MDSARIPLPPPVRPAPPVRALKRRAGSRRPRRVFLPPVNGLDLRTPGPRRLTFRPPRPPLHAGGRRGHPGRRGSTTPPPRESRCPPWWPLRPKSPPPGRLPPRSPPPRSPPRPGSHPTPKPAKTKASVPRKPRTKPQPTPGPAESASSLPDAPPPPATPEETRPPRKRTKASGPVRRPGIHRARKARCFREAPPRAGSGPLRRHPPSRSFLTRRWSNHLSPTFLPRRRRSSVPHLPPTGRRASHRRSLPISRKRRPGRSIHPPFQPVPAASPALPEPPSTPPVPASLRQIRDLKDIRVPRVPVAFAPARRKLPPMGTATRRAPPNPPTRRRRRRRTASPYLPPRRWPPWCRSFPPPAPAPGPR